MFEILIKNDLMSSFFKYGPILEIVLLSLVLVLRINTGTEKPAPTRTSKAVELILLLLALLCATYFISTLIFLKEVKEGSRIDLTKLAATSENVKAGKQDFSMLVFKCLGFNQESGSFSCNDRSVAALLENVSYSDISDKESYIEEWRGTGELSAKNKSEAGKVAIAIGLTELAKFSKVSEENSKFAKEKINWIAPHLVEFYEKELVRLVLNDIPRPDGSIRTGKSLKEKAFSRIKSDCYSLSGESCSIIKKVIKAESSQSL